MRSEPRDPGPVLVTGATGLVGRAVLSELRRAGVSVVALARSPWPPRPGVQTIRGDVRDRAVLDACFAHGPKAVVQLVGLRIHTEATEAVVEAARRHGVRRYVHVSALGAGEKPGIAYHRRKWVAEERVRVSSLDYTILRPSVIFGEGCDFLRSLLAIVRLVGVTPMVGSGRTRLQPIYVGDVAAVVRRCLDDAGTVLGCYDLGGPEVVTLDEIVTRIERQLGRPKTRVHVPLVVARLLASPPFRPFLAFLLSCLGASVHPERRLNPSHIELLAEDNVCAAPLDPAIADLCGTALFAWLSSFGDGVAARAPAWAQPARP